MMLVRSYLAPSSIEGLGVFASEPIRKGDVVWKFDRTFDQVLSLDQVNTAPAHMRDFIERYSYAFHDDPGFVVLDADDGRFMNHADAPNLDFRDPVQGVALRDIAADEELTCDYACFTIGPVVFQPPRRPGANGDARA